MSRRKLIAVWIFSVLLAGLYVYAGIPKVSGAEPAVQGFRDWGLSDGMRLFVGFAEISGGIGLLIPPLAMWAALGLVCIMVGAMYEVLIHAPPVQALPALGCLLVLLFIAHARRGQALFLAR
jgi:uncharacterized membrane protein YphA (DoxX/SURF4 family)